MSNRDPANRVADEGRSWRDGAGYWSECERLARIARYLDEHAPDLQARFCDLLTVAGGAEPQLRD